MATSEKKTCFDAGKIRIWHCAAVFQTQVPKLCTDLDLSLIHILISGTYSKFARKFNFLALGVYCPAGQSAFRTSRPQLKLGEEIESSRLVGKKQFGWGNRIFYERMFIIPPPGLASSFLRSRNFSKEVRFSNKKFPDVAPHKNVSAYFSPNYYTAPVPSLRPWSSSSGCVFGISGQWWPGAYMNADM